MLHPAQLNLKEIIKDDGTVDVNAQALLSELVEQYPYYHAARMLLLRLLYQQHDSLFNEELRKAALFLPSRAKIYQEIEGDSMRPKPQEKSSFSGATHERKSKTPIDISSKTSRTDELLGNFLLTTPPMLWDSRSGRPVDATTDYIGYLQYQESLSNDSEGETSNAKQVSSPGGNEPSVEGAGNESKDRLSEFLNSQSGKRITLSEKKDSELQKPVIVENDSAGQQGAFTETLARIYIKQGKFEQAIEIIRRLSLKYPKKNRYFADQIRFLEKLILNNQSK